MKFNTSRPAEVLIWDYNEGTNVPTLIKVNLKPWLWEMNNFGLYYKKDDKDSQRLIPWSQIAEVLQD